MDDYKKQVNKVHNLTLGNTELIMKINKYQKGLVITGDIYRDNKHIIDVLNAKIIDQEQLIKKL